MIYYIKKALNIIAACTAALVLIVLAIAYGKAKIRHAGRTAFAWPPRVFLFSAIFNTVLRRIFLSKL